MAPSTGIKTTFEASKVIQPIFTGGIVALDQDGRILVTCANGDAILTDLRSGKELARIEDVGLPRTNNLLKEAYQSLILGWRRTYNNFMYVQLFTS
jgi:U3 small nucleolar RNA-associated protein 13